MSLSSLLSLSLAICFAHAANTNSIGELWAIGIGGSSQSTLVNLDYELNVMHRQNVNSQVSHMFFDPSTGWMYAMSYSQYTNNTIFRFQSDSLQMNLVSDATATFTLSVDEAGAASYIVYQSYYGSGMLTGSLLNGAMPWNIFNDSAGCFDMCSVTTMVISQQTTSAPAYARRAEAAAEASMRGERSVFDAPLQMGSPDQVLYYVHYDRNHYSPVYLLMALPNPGARNLTRAPHMLLNLTYYEGWTIYSVASAMYIDDSTSQLWFARVYMNGSAFYQYATVECYNLKSEPAQSSVVLNDFTPTYGNSADCVFTLDFAAQTVFVIGNPNGPHQSTGVWKLTYAADQMGGVMRTGMFYITDLRTSEYSLIMARPSVCNLDCSTNGRCKGGACQCFTDYYTPTCAVNCNSGITCTGHGTCDPSDGVCVCDPNWFGSDCSTKQLQPPEFPQAFTASNVLVSGPMGTSLQTLTRSLLYQCQVNASTDANIYYDYVRGIVTTVLFGTQQCLQQPLFGQLPEFRVPTNATLVGNVTCTNGGQQEVCARWTDGTWYYTATVDNPAEPAVIVSVTGVWSVTYDLAHFTPGEIGDPNICRLPSYCSAGAPVPNVGLR